MILSATSIKRIQPILPFIPEKRIKNGMSYGLSVASYDVRINEGIELLPEEFSLASTLEYFHLPKNVAGMVIDKSSWARLGLSAFNTYIDPGFQGYMTLELKNNSMNILTIDNGDPIVQIVFFWVDADTDGYSGKYQFQADHAVAAIREEDVRERQYVV